MDIIGSTYHSVLLQASSTVEVDIQTAENLQVSRLDFMASLNNDIKPVSWCVFLFVSSLIGSIRNRKSPSKLVTII